MDDQVGLEAVDRQQVGVLVYYVYDLLWTELGNELYQEGLVVLQNHHPELLEDVLKVCLLLYRGLDHCV